MVFIIMIFIICCISILGVCIWFFSRTNKRREAVAADLGEIKRRRGSCYTVCIDGVDVKIQFIPAGKNTPEQIDVHVPTRVMAPFCIRREGFFDRTAKQFGISHELQTGDKKFDDLYYIMTEDQKYCQNFLASAERRDIIKNLVSNKWAQSMRSYGGYIAVRFAFSISSGKADKIKSVIDKLNQLTCDASPYSINSYSEGPRNYVARKVAVYIGVVAALAVGIYYTFLGGMYQMMDGGAVFSYSLKYTMPIVFAGLFVIYFFLKGFSRSHIDIGITSLILITAALLGSYNYVKYLNCSNDKSIAQVHDQVIAKKDIIQTKNSTHYYVFVPTWRKGRYYERFSVSSSTFRSVKPGKSHMVIVTKSGILGFEWVVKEKTRFS